MRRLWSTALLIVALCGACSSGEPSITTTNTAVEQSTSGIATSSPESGNGFPGVLVGAWSSSGDTTEIAYRFLTDGRYRSAEILSQPVPGGLFEFSVIQDGRANVQADQLVLTPTSATGNRHHPSSPQEDYTNRALPLEERVYSWRVDGTALHLRDETGLELVLKAQDE